jgi:hypothetical protein
MRGGELSSAAELPSATEVPSAVGSGRSSVTIRSLPSKTAERDSTERKVHPEVRSPSLTPVAIFDVWSKKIAIRLFSLMIVPTRVKGGNSNATGLATATGGDTGAAATAGGGGRLDAENSGRSRVAESLEMGIAHNGFPVAETSGGGDPVSAAASLLTSGFVPSVSIAATATW